MYISIYVCMHIRVFASVCEFCLLLLLFFFSSFSLKHAASTALFICKIFQVLSVKLVEVYIRAFVSVSCFLLLWFWTLLRSSTWLNHKTVQSTENKKIMCNYQRFFLLLNIIKEICVYVNIYVYFLYMCVCMFFFTILAARYQLVTLQYLGKIIPALLSHDLEMGSCW